MHQIFQICLYFFFFGILALLIQVSQFIITFFFVCIYCDLGMAGVGHRVNTSQNKTRTHNPLGQRCFDFCVGINMRVKRGDGKKLNRQPQQRETWSCQGAKKNNGWHEKYVFVQMKLRKMNCRQFVVLIGSVVVMVFYCRCRTWMSRMKRKMLH